MRSPRALIPLFSACAAAVVFAVAATGAGIEEPPAGAGSAAYADGAAAPPPAAVTVNAMSWNVCGAAGSGCPSGAAPADLGEQIVKRMKATEVGGRDVAANAVLLQEVCEGHVRGFEKKLGSWSWAFAPLPKGPSCARGQGRLGVAIGTDVPLVDTAKTKLPAPPGRAHIALCGDVPSWATRVCVTQFSPDESDDWRRKQARELVDLAGTGRVLVGGDLADDPGSPSLDPLYDAYAECDQTGSSRTGAKTRQNWQGTAVEKTDYLFITKSAGVSCSVPGSTSKTSDHRPLSAVVRYLA